MKKAERVLVSFVAVTLIMEIVSAEGGGQLAMLSVMLLTVFYFLFSFALLNNIPVPKIFSRESYHGISVFRMIGAILTGFSLPTIILGILYKVLSWPGGLQLLLIGVIQCMMIGLIATIKLSTTKNKFYKEVLWRAGLMTVAGVIFFFIGF